MGSETKINARKTNFETIAFRTFHFERILNNDTQDPNENLTLLILKVHNILLPKSPHGT